MIGGVARIIFVVSFGAVTWISRVPQFAVIPCWNARVEISRWSYHRKIDFECGWKRI